MANSDRSQTVSLGCGTLILIALIVIFFSGGGKVGDLERDVQELQREVRELRTAVDEQTAILRRLEAGQKPAEQPLP